MTMSMTMMSECLKANKKLYKCDVCNSSFRQKANLTRHYRIHTGERRYKCDICNKSFIEKCKLKIHHRVHSGTKNFQCQECGRTFAENRNLRQHQLIHSGLKPHTCEICNRSFRYISDFKEHQSVHLTVKSHLCSSCGHSFKSVRTLRRHFKSFHGGTEHLISSAAGTKFDMSTDDLTVKISQALHSDNDLSDTRFQNHNALNKSSDQLCNRESTNGVLHQNQSSTDLTVQQKLGSSSDVVMQSESIEPNCQHDIQFLDISHSSTQPPESDLQNTRFTNTIPVDQHVIPSEYLGVLPKAQTEVTDDDSGNKIGELSVHGQSEVVPMELSKRSSKPFPEFVPNGQFNAVDASKALLLLSQQKQKTLLRSKDKLQLNAKHMKPGHVTQAVKLNFENAEKKLKTAKLHSNTKQSNSDIKYKTSTKCVECKVCKKNFQHSGALKQHMKTHESVSNQCQICSKSFCKSSNLRQHLKIHLGVKEFCCDTCGQMFLLRSALKSHLKVHNVLRPFKCTSCDSAYKNRCDLVNHLRIHSGSKPYQCSNCGKTFSLNSSLRRHIRAHSSDLPYSCSICGRKFSQNGNMHKHINSYHVVKDNSVCRPT